ncbi:MAG: DUF4091 domain-containing protein [Finegoldia magna]|uniref:DUF4091 domain-containing protein n=1 Tax=Finegoldia magna TaxID=1260 RepID=UPI002911B96E|nr:DUF4091 domain-containing protein [Finegoldia magna]MDU5369746.1 DUF4091 domain-containing protein [Finegoldia magna]MDU5444663.1 DUF4091 domain-containing protein [Finegoldia magna]
MIRFIPSTVRQIGNLKNNCEEINEKFALKNEETSVQLELFLDKKMWVNLDDVMTLPWEGLVENLRFEIESVVDCKLYFEGDVLDDDKIYKKDVILNKRSSYLPKGYSNLWLEMKSDTEGIHNVTIKIFKSEGSGDEELIFQKTLKLEVSSIEIPEKNIFYLDLWQHLSSLARVYDVEYYSDEHFRIIEKFMKPLADAGQKVCDLIVSDYSWAGQECFKIYDNQSSLYEYNLIKPYIKNGKLQLDFSALDRFIEICKNLGMCEEINLFGIIGNWNRGNFSVILEDFDEPIKVRVHDLGSSKFTFIRTKKMYEEYIRQIFEHLVEKNLWDITRIMADQPRNVGEVSEGEDLLRKIRDDVKIKYAIMHGDFFENYDQDTENFSIILNEYIRVQNGGLKMSDKSNFRNMTWYVCWTPFNLNQFVKSSLIESRLVGYMTYLFDMKGFLRWNYCLYPDSNDYRYRPDRWACGDMFFVYPGKSGVPELSLRFKQLSYGNMDYSFLRYCESKLGRCTVLELVKEFTGEIADLSYNEQTREISGSYKDDYNLMESIKKKLALKLKK